MKYLSDFNLSTRQIFCGVDSDRSVQLMTTVFSKFAKLYPDIKPKLIRLFRKIIPSQTRLPVTPPVIQCEYAKNE